MFIVESPQHTRFRLSIFSRVLSQCSWFERRKCFIFVLQAKKVKKEETKTGGKVKKEENEVWRWWEEEKRADGVKWTFLEHRGPVFAPPYEPLPPDIKFYYDGQLLRIMADG